MFDDVVIEDLYGYEILDSRGNPTIEGVCVLSDGTEARVAIPSGKSVGKHEAHELRDGDKRYNGKGVRNAITYLNRDIFEELEGLSPFMQQEIDDILIELDGTHNKSRLGANAILAASLSIAKASALSLGIELFEYLGGIKKHYLPVPFLNILNGGEHADNGLDIQEYMIAPVNFDTFSDALRAGVEIYHALRQILLDKHLSIGIGDEGGFAPTLSSNTEPFELIIRAIEKAGYVPGEDILLAIDAAANSFYRDGKYHLTLEDKHLSSEEFANLYKEWTDHYPLVSIEDGMAEMDEHGWIELTELIGEDIQLIGDDIFVTQMKLLKQGIDKAIANGILIKPNQVGSLSETLETVSFAQSNGYSTMVSHRSGDTCDPVIVHIAVGLDTLMIKSGAPCRGERLSKYNELLRIEYEQGLEYAGKLLIE